MTTERNLPVADLRSQSKSLIELRDTRVKSERGAMLYLDPMKRGDVATLSLNGVSVLFVCGTPRARFDHATELLTLSRQIRSLPDAEWIFEQIYATFPGWRSREERNQNTIENLIEIK